MAKQQETKEKETETKETETETETETTAEQCKKLLFTLSSEECAKFNLMVYNEIDLYNLVMGGVKPQ